MTTVPKQIEIGGSKIHVVVEPMEEWGAYCHDTSTITLSPKTIAKKSSLRETLRHEMLHASLQISGVGFMERYDEEPIVRCMDGVFWPAWERVRKRLNI